MLYQVVLFGGGTYVPGTFHWDLRDAANEARELSRLVHARRVAIHHDSGAFPGSYVGGKYRRQRA